MTNETRNKQELRSLVDLIIKSRNVLGDDDGKLVPKAKYWDKGRNELPLAHSLGETQVICNDFQAAYRVLHPNSQKRIDKMINYWKEPYESSIRYAKQKLNGYDGQWAKFHQAIEAFNPLSRLGWPIVYEMYEKFNTDNIDPIAHKVGNLYLGDLAAIASATALHLLNGSKSPINGVFKKSDPTVVLEKTKELINNLPDGMSNSSVQQFYNAIRKYYERVPEIRGICGNDVALAQGKYFELGFDKEGLMRKCPEIFSRPDLCWFPDFREKQSK